jgi:plasmid stabilization system protein ParE
MEYIIKYLPVARKDLIEIIGYISEKLEAPKAALNFIDEFEKKILGLRINPYSHRLYRPSKPIDTEYRLLSVKNYLVFYVVVDNIVEIHRIIYNKRNLSETIK